MAGSLQDAPAEGAWAEPRIGHAQVRKAFRLLNASRTISASIAGGWGLHMFLTMSPSLEPIAQTVATGSGGMAILVLIAWLGIPYGPAMIGILSALISTVHLAFLHAHDIIDALAIGLVATSFALCVPLIRARILLIQDPDGLASARRFGRLTRSSRPRRIMRSACGALLAFVILAGWQGTQTYHRGRIPDSLVPVMAGFRSAWNAEDPADLRKIVTAKDPDAWAAFAEERTRQGFDGQRRITQQVTVRAYATRATVGYALDPNGRIETYWELTDGSWRLDFLLWKH
ncbi:MAG: hypothetical protein VX951_13385 [Planctomycetota bacterium]|nr:hypothetical protein [Planctomycetota bacterium]